MTRNSTRPALNPAAQLRTLVARLPLPQQRLLRAARAASVAGLTEPDCR